MFESLWWAKKGFFAWPFILGGLDLGNGVTHLSFVSLSIGLLEICPPTWCNSDGRSQQVHTARSHMPRSLCRFEGGTILETTMTVVGREHNNEGGIVQQCTAFNTHTANSYLCVALTSRCVHSILGRVKAQHWFLLKAS